MIDASKLQYFTMAAWMRGYADGLNEFEHEFEHEALINKLNKAADMFDAVWKEYQERLDNETP